ncbi:glycosyltransferase [Paucibacter sp. M5-1]|uniref:glycosyltransferase n=1 Tax=Paucibacter sp. M5-1 TaxID=3015998 RepID=UPI0022B85F90|nr:glycosyltransferase [Paucibacter sp. M5-1]MCZ7879468.1 glycosyltransferase [Paucibacter sp. M5-1]
MPRLLNINTYHYRRGGSDAVYLEHAALMGEQGWDNGFFAMQHPKNLPTPWSRYFIDELEFGNAYSTLDKLVMASKVIYSFEAQRKLRELLRDFPADVAHLHCIYHHHSPSILPVLKRAGVPVVMTAHDLKVACPAYKMLNREGVCERCRTGSVLNVIKYRCIRDSLAASAIVAAESGLHRALGTYQKHLDRLVVPSRFFGTKIVEWGFPADKVVYIPNYVDASMQLPQYEPGDYFLYFGRLALEKGVDTLIRAAAAAGVTLKIAGTGPEEESLRALAASVAGDSGARIEFLGFQSGAALHALIREARVVVLPSQWYENAPMSVLESFGFGKPVIGAAIGGIPELVRDGVTGWTFEPGNVQALAGLLSRAVAMPATRLAEAGRAGRAMVETEFTKDRYRAAMLELYADLGVGS